MPSHAPAAGHDDGRVVLVDEQRPPLRDQVEAYAEALSQAGVPVVMRPYDGLIHGFFDLAALSPASADAVAEKTDKTLRPAPTSGDRA